MDDYACCPRCETGTPQVVKFTVWGGTLGPRLLSQVRCRNCGQSYNGKTGKDLAVGMIWYISISALVGLAIALLVVLYMIMLSTAKWP